MHWGRVEPSGEFAYCILHLGCAHTFRNSVRLDIIESFCSKRWPRINLGSQVDLRVDHMLPSGALDLSQEHAREQNGFLLAFPGLNLPSGHDASKNLLRRNL